MATKDLETIPEAAADWIRRVVSYTEDLTYFGPNSPGGAMAQATAEQAVLIGNAGVRALMRRQTLLGASDDALSEVLEEHGVPRLGPSRAQALLVVTPWATTVTAITGALLAVVDAAHFEVGDEVRIVNGDGSTTETLTVAAKHSGTGPSGEDELDIGALLGSYDPTTETVGLLLRRTITEGTIVTSSGGTSFQLLADVTAGDRNPVLLGESSELALADKVWVEAVEPGSAGNVEAETITTFEVEDDKIRAIVNPSAARGGADSEPDFDAKYRAAHQGQLAAVETLAALEALARSGNRDVLRAFLGEASAPSTVAIRVITRSGGGLSDRAREALADYMAARLRSQTRVEVENAVLTAVEIEATVTIAPGSGTVTERLRAAWVAAASRFAAYLDWRKWTEGDPVDEAALIGFLRSTPGIRAVTTSTFLPAADVEVDYVPHFTRLVLTDSATGQVVGASIVTAY